MLKVQYNDNQVLSSQFFYINIRGVCCNDKYKLLGKYRLEYEELT